MAICRLSGLLFLTIYLQAQTSTGELRLQVQDPSGAGTQVSGTLENPALHFTERFETDAQGNYTSQALKFGRYRVSISRTGFASQSIQVDIESPGPVARIVMLAVASQAARVDVVAPTPLTGTDLPLSDIPAPVQTATALDIEQSGSLDLADLLNKRLAGVNINENQGNPFQPDVNYRGYTASPLLGTPEGISVYMDGVRQNQPFGDIVAWDLIPKIAISEVAVLPGSNPLFGLNTLGGAVSLQTKDGQTAPGITLQVNGGSFGRRQGELEYGGANSRGLNWYAAGNWFKEDGWRQFSPSEVRQAFGKLGWLHGKTYLGLSFSYADNSLTGNGLQDGRRLALDYTSVYNVPDFNWNRSPALNLNVRRDVSAKLTFSANAYFRYIRADTYNGNLNANSFDESLYNLTPADVAALKAAGYSGFPITGNPTTEPYPFWRCIAQSLQLAEPVEKCDGLIARSYDKQHNWGATGQASWLVVHNRITLGAGWDRSTLRFQQGSQFAYLNTDGLTLTPVNAFGDGSTNSNGVPVDTRVNLHGLINTPSVFASDTIALGRWSISVSGRYNHTRIQNTDGLPADTSGSRGSLNGNYVFERFNPAAGFTYSPWGLATFYFNYSEASRAPTAIELGCADPNFPCNLPNALVSDPPLKQVVTRTLEAGARGTIENNLRWSAGWFFGQNYNDILFVASPQTGFGYFTNFGKTRRQGVEAGLSGHWRQFTLGGNYTFLDTTYQSPQVIDGVANSANASAQAGTPGLDDVVDIQPGDYIPQIPQNMFKAYLEYNPTAKFSAELNFVAAGRSYARGNENNQHVPDGVYYLGPGYAPAYGVVNLGAHYQLEKRVQLFAQINNVLNHRYYTAAQLGTTPYDNSGNFIARPFQAVDGNYPVRSTTFFAPGAPIGVWGGIRLKF
ncbi:MAG: TonB-dependent receptor [Bryobacterales bacterium]|nr:TonB-dependent receptor [Bryobacterales bacterium]